MTVNRRQLLVTAPLIEAGAGLPVAVRAAQPLRVG